VLALGVQRVGGHHDPRHVHSGQQWSETGDLVGLAVHFALRHDDSAVMGHGGQQMHTALTGLIASAPQRLAVHRDRRTPWS
jgi:hypothetical protein